MLILVEIATMTHDKATRKTTLRTLPEKEVTSAIAKFESTEAKAEADKKKGEKATSSK